MHYQEGTIEIFGIVLGLGFAVVMVVGAAMMSRMLARDEQSARSSESLGKVIPVTDARERIQVRKAA